MNSTSISVLVESRQYLLLFSDVVLVCECDSVDGEETPGDYLEAIPLEDAILLKSNQGHGLALSLIDFAQIEPRSPIESIALSLSPLRRLCCVQVPLWLWLQCALVGHSERTRTVFQS